MNTIAEYCWQIKKRQSSANSSEKKLKRNFEKKLLDENESKGKKDIGKKPKKNLFRVNQHITKDGEQKVESNVNRSASFRKSDVNKKQQGILNTCEGQAIRDQKQGCTQGFCSGPTLWNSVANEILQENWPIITNIHAFTEDFVLLSYDPTRVQLESQIDQSIAKFSTWEIKSQLQISADKTNYLLYIKLISGPTIRRQGERIKRAYAIKYLGVYIDEKMNWNTQLKAQSMNGTQLYQNLLKIAGKS
ncbi:hypothetical protein AVEN_175088-1 [Araneus ventricosus]|uniref:Reverse transcriptase domain-containing protein n=1 Tax=Araneus ventricosus TaxID=182803 RepID=A0A4Y2S164_ARAVE|nr:hypothetical protein AVEN_23379-1 [Araneus ventricosus]GBN81014.1 hypothetical protein AVEN_175088-1 [Araneus ventricosus]